MNKINETSKTVPFFARKVDHAPLTVRTGLRVGAREQDSKAANEPRQK